MLSCLQPENLLLADEEDEEGGHVMLIDFGHAFLQDQQTTPTGL